jgi:DNA-binding MarR family transcriptional regulator
MNPADKTRLAILAVKPKPPLRQLLFLIALSTVTRHRDDGSRKAGIDLLARRAGLTASEATRARNQLAARGLIKYRPGLPGRAGHYRITLPGNPEPAWVRVQIGGRVRWRLADDVELP